MKVLTVRGTIVIQCSERCRQARARRKVLFDAWYEGLLKLGDQMFEELADWSRSVSCISPFRGAAAPSRHRRASSPSCRRPRKSRSSSTTRRAIRCATRATRPSGKGENRRRSRRSRRSKNFWSGGTRTIPTASASTSPIVVFGTRSSRSRARFLDRRRRLPLGAWRSRRAHKCLCSCA